MDEELIQLLNSIKQQTDIDVFAYSPQSGARFSTAENADFAECSSASFDGVFSDEVTGKTYFALNYKQSELVFYIDGTGISEQNYAKFIFNLISNYSDKELVLSRKEYLKAILLGECSKAQIAKYIQKFSAPNYRCYAVIIECEKQKLSECYSIVENYTVGSYDACAVTAENALTYVKFVSDSDEEYLSATEFATYLQRIVYEEGGGETRMFIGGIVDTFDMIQTSYAQAELTLSMVRKSGISKTINSYREHLSSKLFEHLPKQAALQYYKQFTEDCGTQVFEDKELMATASAFLDNDLNAVATARGMYIHRNTLNYRLSKIRRETGLDIRKFTDAFTFRVIALLKEVKD